MTGRRPRPARLSAGVRSFVAAVSIAGLLLTTAACDAGRFGLLGDTCLVTAESRTLHFDPGQVTNAATITAVGVEQGVSLRGVTVALGTALQESKLENLAGGDRDSVGLFQQRPSQGWGTPEELQNPRFSAERFYQSLTKVHGWEGMRLTEAAQAVQRSGHPEAYQKWEAAAETLALVLSGRAPAGLACRIASPGSVGREATLADEARADLAPLQLHSVGDQEFAMTPPASPVRRGWQAAHWFVAKAATYGIRRVSYGGKTWTPERDQWTTDTTQGSEITVELANQPS